MTNLERLNKRMADMPYWERYGFAMLMLADLAPNVNVDTWVEAMVTAPKYGIGKERPVLLKAKGASA